MDFKLFDSKVGGINVLISVHIGQYNISIEEYRYDKTFESEYALQGMPLSKTMEAAGVADTDALKTFMLDNFGTEKGARKFEQFLKKHGIRYTPDCYIRYI